MIYFSRDPFGSALDDVPDSVATVFGLVLNPMTDRTEAQRLVAVSESRDELKRFWEGERAPERYKDGQWSRTYRAGPLEWFNPPWRDDGVDDFGNGIIELRRDGWRRVA